MFFASQCKRFDTLLAVVYRNKCKGLWFVIVKEGKERIERLSLEPRCFINFDWPTAREWNVFGGKLSRGSIVFPSLSIVLFAFVSQWHVRTL